MVPVTWLAVSDNSQTTAWAISSALPTRRKGTSPRSVAAPMPRLPPVIITGPRSEGDTIRPFQIEHLTRLIRAGHLEAEAG